LWVSQAGRRQVDVGHPRTARRRPVRAGLDGGKPLMNDPTQQAAGTGRLANLIALARSLGVTLGFRKPAVVNYDRPTPAKYQRKARLRRLKQKYYGDTTCSGYVEAAARVEADYAEWRAMRGQRRAS